MYCTVSVLYTQSLPLKYCFKKMCVKGKPQPIPIIAQWWELLEHNTSKALIDNKREIDHFLKWKTAICQCS